MSKRTTLPLFLSTNCFQIQDSSWLLPDSLEPIHCFHCYLLRHQRLLKCFFSISNELTSSSKRSLSSFTRCINSLRKFWSTDLSPSISTPWNNASQTTLLICVATTRAADSCITMGCNTDGFTSRLSVCVDAMPSCSTLARISTSSINAMDRSEGIEERIVTVRTHSRLRTRPHNVHDQYLAGSLPFLFLDSKSG